MRRSFRVKGIRKVSFEDEQEEEEEEEDEDDRKIAQARLLRTMIADEEARIREEETRSLPAWGSRDDLTSRLSGWVTLPRNKWGGSLRNLFSRSRSASIDLTADDIEAKDETPKAPEKKLYRRSKSSSVVTLASEETKAAKQKAYRRTKSSSISARPLGVWEEENEVEPEVKSKPRRSSLFKWRSTPRDDDVPGGTTFSAKPLVSILKKTKPRDDSASVRRPLLLANPEQPPNEEIKPTLVPDSYRYNGHPPEVEEPREKPKLRYVRDHRHKSDSVIMPNGTIPSSKDSIRSQYSRPNESERTKQRSYTSASLRSRLYPSDEVYLGKIRDIINSYPNRVGPPYAATMLCPHMYMGSQKNADDLNLLRRLGITHVLNMAGYRHADSRSSPYSIRSGVREYLMIPASDHEDFNIVRHFREAFEFLDHAKRTGGRCLVHCNMGVNRSGAVCAGYLMAEQKMTLLEMVRYLKLKRSFVLVNRGFQRQIVQFAREQGFLEPL